MIYNLSIFSSFFCFLFVFENCIIAKNTSFFVVVNFGDPIHFGT